MTGKQKEYGKLTADDLRLLVSYLPMLDEEQSELNKHLDKNSAEIFTDNSAKVYWCHFYEKPFHLHLNEVVERLGLANDLKAIVESDNPLRQIHESMQNTNSDACRNLTPEQKSDVIPFVLALNNSLVFSLRSLMVYGCYLNDLIAIAREGEPSKRDNALFKAIRIDLTVIGCPTAISRISRGILMNDAVFMSGLRKALSGKLGVRESNTFHKMRYVLQVLHESGGIHLNDKALRELFVEVLNLYSDSQSTSEKNLKEFTYKFKKQKSTI